MADSETGTEIVMADLPLPPDSAEQKVTPAKPATDAG